MNIGVDIDGCLNDVHHFLINEGIKWKLNNGYKNVKFNNDNWNFDQVFEMNDEEKEKFMFEKSSEILMNVKAREEASNVIKKLREEGNKIIIITNRPVYDKCFHNNGRLDISTVEWLNKNNIEYDKIIFSENKKEKVCIDEKINIMIEDMEKSAKKISKSTPVLLFRTTYNKDIKRKNITMVYTWYDIYTKISNKI